MKRLTIITVLAVLALCGMAQADSTILAPANGVTVNQTDTLTLRKAKQTLDSALKKRFPSYKRRAGGGVTCAATNRASPTKVGCDAAWTFKSHAFVGFIDVTLRSNGVHYSGSIDRGPKNCFPEGCGNDKHYKVHG